MYEILKRCNYIYNKSQDCTDKYINGNKNGDCLVCTRNNFYSTNNDIYSCLKKLSTYTMLYGPIYVSEIYHFLEESNFLKLYIEEQRNINKNSLYNEYDNLANDSSIPISINIMSLGCGFGPDDIALNKYKADHLDVNVNFNYVGLDKEPLWNFITNTNSLPLTYDLLNGMAFNNVNILFINKLFSTFYNHGLHVKFLNSFQQALINLPINSFIVFNDINVLDLTEKSLDIHSFHPFMINLNLECIGKYFFNTPRSVNGDMKYPMNFNNRYMNLNTNSIYSDLSNNFAIPSMIEATQSVIFLYKKVV